MTNGHSFLVAVFALIWGITFGACGYKAAVSENEVKDRIEKDIPRGSNISQVLAFLNSLEIKGLKAEHSGFIPGKPAGTDRPTRNQGEVMGYVIASIKNAARDDSKLQVYRIEIFLYFDKDQRLIDYKTQTRGDW